MFTLPERAAAGAALASVLCVTLVSAQAPQGKAQVVVPQRDAQPAPHRTAVIAGAVVAADSGRPVRRVHVSISSTSPDVTLSATTADDGRFRFTDLPAGAFIVSASRGGYIDSVLGQKQPGSGRPGTPVQLIDGQKVENVSLPLARAGVITGTVLDDKGEPEFGAQVRVLRWTMRSGERTLVTAMTATTDDRGMYRATALQPGDYVVSATSSDMPSSDQAAALAKRMAEVSAIGDSTGAAIQELKMTIASLGDPSDPSKDQPTGYAPVYFPGTTSPAAAQTLTLGVSEERQGIDVALQLVPLTRVSGVVVNAQAGPGAVQVVLTPTGTAVPMPGPRSARAGADGRFSFASVPPGAYTIMAISQQGGAAAKIADLMSIPGKIPAPTDFSQSWAMTDIAVDGRQLAPITLALQSGLALPGRVVFTGAAPPPDLSRVRILVAPISASSPERAAAFPSVIPDASGHFVIGGLVPGRYRINVAGAGAAWSVGSAVVGPRDVMDTPLELRASEDPGTVTVTMTDRVAIVSGTLMDSSSRATADYTVVAFPTDSTLWLPQARRIQATRPSTDGRYMIRGLPPGDYGLAVISDVETGQWYDPAWLKSVTGQAVGFTLSDGQHLIKDVRVAK
jgi:hypothetical protein